MNDSQPVALTENQISRKALAHILPIAVFMGFLLELSFNLSTFLSKLGCTNGPFQIDLVIIYFSSFFLL